MSNFRQHYAQLHDDELIHIALTRDLSSEASSALKDELSHRGLSDLSSHKAELERELIADQLHRAEQIEHRKSVNALRTKIILLVASALCAYGSYRLVVPNKDSPSDDGGIILVVGIALALFAPLRAWLSNMWSRHVLHRPPA